MNKLCLIILLLICCTSFAQQLTLTGTIGKLPVAMQLSCTNGSWDGSYYYYSKCESICFSGRKVSGRLKLSATARIDEKGVVETERFDLAMAPDKSWSGTWKNKAGKKLQVKLKPISTVNLRTDWDDVASVQKMKTENPFEYLRLANLKLIEERVEKRGKYTIASAHIDKTEIAYLVVKEGLPDTRRLAINELITGKAISLAIDVLTNNTCYSGEDNASPTDDNFYAVTLINSFIGDNVLSLAYSIGYYTGGAHPDHELDVLNIDLNTGKELRIADFLSFSPVPAKFDSTNTYDDYYSNEFIPGMLKMLAKLYPVEMNGRSESQCDYTDTGDYSVWNDMQWYFTDKGIQLRPRFPYIINECGEAPWAVLPYSAVKKHIRKSARLKVP